MKVKGADTDLYRYDLAIGYGILYLFVICTTESPIAFTYALPVTSLLVLYKDKWFMKYCGIINTGRLDNISANGFAFLSDDPNGIYRKPPKRWGYEFPVRQLAFYVYSKIPCTT